MQLLRKIINDIILEGQRFDNFQEWLGNQSMDDYISNWATDVKDRNLETMHKDHLRKKLYSSDGIPEESPSFDSIDKDVDQYFKNRKDIKRYWNENCDRSFWQGPKMKYFHSLSYYKTGTADKLEQNVSNEIGVKNLSLIGFASMYKISGNKDEMSTWGVYNGSSLASAFDRKIGVELEGRVTLAVKGDGMVESRSKASHVDMQTYVGSGLRKRPSTSKRYTDALLFDEEDVNDNGTKNIGECILSNWGVKAIWYNPKYYSYDEIDDIEAFGNALGIPVGDVRSFIKRKITY